MKLVDMLRKSSHDKNIRNLLANQIFHARRRQEDAVTLKTFRAFRYGNYSTRVPGAVWTPHADRPLPESNAEIMANCENREFPVVNDDSPCIPGQQLYGCMVPRPRKEWALNREASMREQQRLAAILLDPNRDWSIFSPGKKASALSDDGNGLHDEGVEVRVSTYEKAASLVDTAPTMTFRDRVTDLFSWNKRTDNTSLADKTSSMGLGLQLPIAIDGDDEDSEAGVEVDLNDLEAGFGADNIQSEASNNEIVCDVGVDAVDVESEDSFVENWEANAPVNISNEYARDRVSQNSMGDVGFEVVDATKNDDSVQISEGNGEIEVDEEASSVENEPVEHTFDVSSEVAATEGEASSTMQSESSGAAPLQDQNFIDSVLGEPVNNIIGTLRHNASEDTEASQGDIAGGGMMNTFTGDALSDEEEVARERSDVGGIVDEGGFEVEVLDMSDHDAFEGNGALQEDAASEGMASISTNEILSDEEDAVHESSDIGGILDEGDLGVEVVNMSDEAGFGAESRDQVSRESSEDKLLDVTAEIPFDEN